MSGGLNHTAPQVRHVTVRCPRRSEAHAHGSQPTRTFGCVSLCPLAQTFGSRSLAFQRRSRQGYLQNTVHFSCGSRSTWPTRPWPIPRDPLAPDQSVRQPSDGRRRPLDRIPTRRLGLASAPSSALSAPTHGSVGLAGTSFDPRNRECLLMAGKARRVAALFERGCSGRSDGGSSS
jgi:hypothetical protein